jgi:hypothetical protein
MAPITPLLKKIIQRMDEFGIVAGLLAATFIAGYEWKHPKLQGPKKSPRSVEIATCEDSEVAPSFFHDGALILKQDIGEKKSRVFVVESDELHGYNPFTWTLELYPEFPTYGLLVKSAYLHRTNDSLAFYHPLRWQRQGGQFPVSVPPSEAKEKILVLLAISGDQEIPTDCKRLVKATVGPPTE